MGDTSKNSSTDKGRWKDLYRIGGIASISVAFLVILAIGAFFIWPYNASTTAMGDLFSNLQKNRIGGLLSLDLLMLITLTIYLFTILALYAILKQTNDSYALIALSFGLLAIASVITSRPLVEMVTLSDKFAHASTEIEKNTLVYAGETFRLLFSGTAWFFQTIFLLLSGLINSMVMLKSNSFGQKTAWLGIIASFIGLFFWIPKIGIGFLFLNTILTIPWCFLVGLSFLKLFRMKEEV